MTTLTESIKLNISNLNESIENKKACIKIFSESIAREIAKGENSCFTYIKEKNELITLNLEAIQVLQKKVMEEYWNLSQAENEKVQYLLSHDELIKMAQTIVNNDDQLWSDYQDSYFLEFAGNSMSKAQKNIIECLTGIRA